MNNKKKTLANKIIKAKRKILTDCVERLESLLSQSKNLTDENVLGRWSLHHSLLSELKLLETIISQSKDNQIMIKDVKSIDNDIVPKGEACYV